MAYICGKWRWHDAVPCSPPINANWKFEISFTFDGKSCIGFKSSASSNGTCSLSYMKDGTTSYLVTNYSYDNTSETGFLTFYRGQEIDFGAIPQEIDDEFYGFFIVNADCIDTIAEKLQYIAENEQRVYDKGVADGKASGGYDEGYSKAESDFWDAVQESGKRTEYAYAFSRWASEYIRPKYKVVLKNAGSQKNMFYMNKYVKKIESAYFDFSQLPRGSNDNQAFSYCFTSSTALEEIEDIGLPISYSYAYAFAWCSKLKKVAMIRVDASTQGMGNAFTSCIALESVAFEGEIGISLDLHWSTKLNLASMQNIVNCLAEGVSGKTLTLSQTAVNNIQGVSGGDFVTPSTGTDTVEWINIQTEARRKGWDIVLA